MLPSANLGSPSSLPKKRCFSELLLKASQEKSRLGRWHFLFHLSCACPSKVLPLYSATCLSGAMLFICPTKGDSTEDWRGDHCTQITVAWTSGTQVPRTGEEGFKKVVPHFYFFHVNRINPCHSFWGVPMKLNLPFQESPVGPTMIPGKAQGKGRSSPDRLCLT
jgi:hypothetical protein